MFYLKLFVFVCFATVVAWFTVDHLINKTDRFAQHFDVNTTAYMDKEETDEELVAVAEVPVREKSELELQIEKERKVAAQEALDRKKQRELDEVNNALSTETRAEALRAEGEEEEEEDGVEESEEDESDEDQDGGGGGGSNREDSDADMQERGKGDEEESEDSEQNQIIGRIGRNDSDFEKQADTIQALDLAYAPPQDSNCTIPESDVVRVGVHYRDASFAIKGNSLTNIDLLIKLYNQCGGGKMLVLQNAEGLGETKERLIQLRKDEVKYYLLQRRVPKDDMIFPDNS